MAATPRPMSSPEPAAAAAGASATKMPAPIIEPSPIVTASARPRRRCSAGSSGVLTEGDTRPRRPLRTPTHAPTRSRPTATMTGQQDRADRHQRDRPQTAQHHRRLALADVVATAGLGRLREVGEVSGTALDLEAELVVHVDVDGEVEREQPGGDQREAEHAEVEGAVVVVMQQSLPGHVVQTPTSTRLC